MSCRYQARSGADGSFTGYIARKGLADLPPGKRVLVWTVLAERADIELPALAGRYVGDTGGQTTGVLKGGKSNAIVLKPMTITSQVGDKPVPSVLELRLEPVPVAAPMVRSTVAARHWKALSPMSKATPAKIRKVG